MFCVSLSVVFFCLVSGTHSLSFSLLLSVLPFSRHPTVLTFSVFLTNIFCVFSFALFITTSNSKKKNLRALSFLVKCARHDLLYACRFLILIFLCVRLTSISYICSLSLFIPLSFIFDRTLKAPFRFLFVCFVVSPQKHTFFFLLSNVTTAVTFSHFFPVDACVVFCAHRRHSEERVLHK